MKKTFLLFLLLPVFIACNSDSSSLNKENYQRSKTNILKKEQDNPKDFLVVSGDKKRNIVGQTVVRGKIKNTAALAKFKDVTIKIYFYSKTKTLVETEDETIYEQFFPGDTKSFKTKYFAPKGTDSVALEILGAKIGD